MTGSGGASPSQPGERLERALELFLADSESTAPDAARLLDGNQDLRDLLEPMLAGAAAASASAPAKSEEPAPGTAVPGDGTVLGDYRLVREIGRGGMGVVHEAWQRSLDRRVALKELAPALLASPGAVARFRREAAAAGRLRHPGIVEVFEFASAGGRHFFSMQLVDGEPLHLCAARFRSPAAAVALIAQVLAALQHAHAAGIVHRDVKPANVLVRSDGTAVLSDFGLASDENLPSMTREGGFLGTLDYASPEQVRGERADARADVFAVGVMLWELLAGRHPFRAATQEATLRAILEHDPPSLHDVERRVPVDLAAIAGRALERDPGRRYASAAAMAADLAALQRGEPVSARLPSWTERAWRLARRDPWRATAAVLLLVGVPIATGAAGYVLAKAPAIAAGEQSIAARAREAVLASAWLDYAAGDFAAALRRLDALPAANGSPAPVAADAPGADSPGADSDEEAAILRTVLLVLLQRRDDAARTIAPWTTPAALRLARSQQLPHPSLDAAAADTREPARMMECFVGGVTAYAQAMRTDDDPKPFRPASALLHRAVLLAPAPRPSLFVMLVRAAARAGDKAMLTEARLALEQHYGDQPFTQDVLADALAIDDPAAGLALFQQRAAAEPARAALQFNLGVLCGKLGRRDEAEAAYRRCVELDPDHANAWNNLGMLLRQRGATADAIAAYRRAVGARPDFAKAWNNLGNALAETDRDGAVAAFGRALAASPGYARANYNLGNLHLAAGQFEQAIAAYQSAIATDPDYMRALSNLAVAYLRTGRFAEALPHAERALALAPNDAGRLENVATIAVELGRTELARSATARLIELAPTAPNTWTLRAWACLALPGADPAAAVAAAQRAQTLAPDQFEPTLALARALATANRPDEARPLLTGLQQTDPTDLTPRLRNELDTLRAQLAR